MPTLPTPLLIIHMFLECRGSCQAWDPSLSHFASACRVCVYCLIQTQYLTTPPLDCKPGKEGEVHLFLTCGWHSAVTQVSQALLNDRDMF